MKYETSRKAPKGKADKIKCLNSASTNGLRRSYGSNRVEIVESVEATGIAERYTRVPT